MRPVSPRTRGIRLEGKKEATILVWTLKRFDPPAKVRITADVPIVSLGDKVKTGQKISEPSDLQSVARHASISGTVTAMDSDAIEIESDKLDQKIASFGAERQGWDQLGPEALRSLFQDFGLVDLDAGMTPVHLKTAPKVQTLVLNACEPEPYLTSEHALMMGHPLEILKGAEILRKALGAQEIILLTQENKLEVAELFKSKIFFLKWNHARVEVIPNIYPPHFSYPDAITFNVATAFAVYEAIVFQKPLIERAMTVGGECLIEPKNVWARMGTEFDVLIKYAKGFLRQPGKIIWGGPMAGRALENLQTTVTPGMQGLLALPEELVKPEQVEPCIRCSKCVDACPVDISPALITLAAEQEQFALAMDYGAETCIECGNCSYVCPSKRPMVELIQYARNQNRRREPKKPRRLAGAPRQPVTA